MILEGILTTTDPDGGSHAAAMGAIVPDDAIEPSTGRISRFQLRPYGTSATYGNLEATPEGVFHLTDDVFVLSRIVVGSAGTPAMRPATTVRGRILVDACLAYEFRGSFEASASPSEGSSMRGTLAAEVTAFHAIRPFLGFNRAAAAVLETAILVSRIGIVPLAEIVSQVDALEVIVRKTAGPREREAFALLRARLAAG